MILMGMLLFEYFDRQKWEASEQHKTELLNEIECLEMEIEKHKEAANKHFSRCAFVQRRLKR